MKLIAKPVLVVLRNRIYLCSCGNSDRVGAEVLVKGSANVLAVKRQYKNWPIATQTVQVQITQWCLTRGGESYNGTRYLFSIN